MLVRTDAAGATHTFTHHLAAMGVEFSVGAYLHQFDIHWVLAQLPEQAWTPAYQVAKPRAGQRGPIIEPREGAWVAEATDKSFRTPEEVRRRLGLAVVGHVPRIKPNVESQRQHDAGLLPLDPSICAFYHSKSIEAE